MAYLMYHTPDGQHKKHQFAQEVRIGSNPEGNDFVLPSAEGVAAEHAIITWSALNRLPVFVDLTDGHTWVNHQPVVQLQILHHGDKLRLGQAELRMWEVILVRLKQGNRAVGRECLVCFDRFEVRHEVIDCPRCHTPHHRDCWLSQEVCAYYGCGYPIRETIMNTLAQAITIERELDEDSALVQISRAGHASQEGAKCPAGNPRDEVPFQVGNPVAFCPSCRTPYHLECFLSSDHLACGFDVRDLIDKLLMAGAVEPK